MATLSSLIRNIISFSCLLTIIILTCLCVSCRDRSDEPQAGGSEDVKPVGRTVLVYMVARNSLGDDEFDFDDLEEMKLAARNGAFGNNRLIVFHSRKGATPQLKEVTRNGVKTLKSYARDIQSLDKVSMQKVIADAKAFAPASKYGLVLWSHGSGWLQIGLRQDSPKRAFGEDMGRQMNVTSLAEVLNGAGFDYIYFDCCFMAGVEVVFQLRNAADYIVASASELPSPGMPYHLTLPYLMADDANLPGAANETFGYYDALSGNDRTCTISVIATDGLPELACRTALVYGKYPVMPAISSVQQFVSRSSPFHNLYFDFEDFMNGIAGQNPGSDVPGLCADAVNALNDCVRYKAATPYLWQRDNRNSAVFEVKVNSHCGLTTFPLPASGDAGYFGYDELDWYRQVLTADCSNN